jgi:hypothetical protein
MKSAAGEARTPTPHAPATSAETHSDSATEKETDFKENETGLFKALLFVEGKSEVGLQTSGTVEMADPQLHLTTPPASFTRECFSTLGRRR